MKIATKITKVLGLFLLTLTLAFCGREGEGISGGNITINPNSGEISNDDGSVETGEITLYAPTVTREIMGVNVTFSISVEDQTYLSHYEVERREGGTDANPFVYIGETSTSTYEDSALALGSYTYRIVAVYVVDDVEHISEPTETRVRITGGLIISD